MESLDQIVATTRAMMAEGRCDDAARYSGEAVARLHQSVAQARFNHAATSMQLADMLFAIDNHLRVLFTQSLYTDIFTTAIVALAQSLADVAAINDDDSLKIDVNSACMLLMGDALSALIGFTQSAPPVPDSPEADYLSNMLVESASLLFVAYNKIKAANPDNPELPAVYDLLNQLLPLGAIRSTVVIADKEIPAEDAGALLGDLLGRAMALGWFAD